jgi:acetylxylan esterase
MTTNKLLLLSLLFVPLALAQAGTKCATGVHMIIARASTENPGPGVIGQVATDVMQQVPGSDMVAVDYPATLQNYQSSEGQGTTAMTQLVRSYAAACPTGKIALMGYSQGAQVALDTVCGTSEQGFTATQPLSGNVTSNIVAVVLMGDPSHNAKAPWNQGTSTNDGVSSLDFTLGIPGPIVQAQCTDKTTEIPPPECPGLHAHGQQDCVVLQ